MDSVRIVTHKLVREKVQWVETTTAVLLQMLLSPEAVMTHTAAPQQAWIFALIISSNWTQFPVNTTEKAKSVLVSRARKKKKWRRHVEHVTAASPYKGIERQLRHSMLCLRTANKTWKNFYITSFKKKFSTFFFLLDLKEWICAMVPTLLHERWLVLHSPALLRFGTLGLSLSQVYLLKMNDKAIKIFTFTNTLQKNVKRKSKMDATAANF